MMQRLTSLFKHCPGSSAGHHGTFSKCQGFPPCAHDW